MLIDNENYSVHFEEGIMRITYKCKILDLDIAKNSIEDRIIFFNNPDQYLFTDGLSVGYWTSKARAFMGKKEIQKFIDSSSALLNQSPLLLNLLIWFTSIFSESIPLKLFKEREKALTWLKVQMKKKPLIEEK
jgi:hypothetical protein